MNDYLEIFSDVVLLATFQPRGRERYPSGARTSESVGDRPRALSTLDRRSEGPVRT